MHLSFDSSHSNSGAASLDECLQCEEGTVADAPGSASCTSCADRNSKTVGTNRVLCICKDGWLAVEQIIGDNDNRTGALIRRSYLHAEIDLKMFVHWCKRSHKMTPTCLVAYRTRRLHVTTFMLRALLTSSPLKHGGSLG